MDASASFDDKTGHARGLAAVKRARKGSQKGSWPLILAQWDPYLSADL